MSSSEWVSIPALKVRQPIGDFYIGAVPAQELAAICKADVRRLEGINIGEGGKPDVFAYMGIQRPLNPFRVNEIREYVQTIDACFPNTIIVSISSDDVRLDGNSDTIQIRRSQDVATIIDGQHRLAGFTSDLPDTPFDLLVTIFIDMEVEEQAYMFSTINTKQTKLNPSLARDLLDFSKIQTPEKVTHNIAKSSNSDPASPWWRQIKMLGVKSEIAGGIITQHAFVTEILNLLYPFKDFQNRVISTLKEHGNDRLKLKAIFEPDPSKFPLWDFYLTKQDEQMKKILDNYFHAVRNTFPDDWASKNSILSKTTGYRALMAQLRLLLPIGMERRSLSVDFFLPFMEQARSSLGGRPLTGTEFGAGAAAAEHLRVAMFERPSP